MSSTPTRKYESPPKDDPSVLRRASRWLMGKSKATGWIAWTAIIGLILAFTFDFARSKVFDVDKSISHQLEEISSDMVSEGFFPKSITPFAMRGFTDDSHLVVSSDRSLVQTTSYDGNYNSDRVSLFQDVGGKLQKRLEIQPRPLDMGEYNIPFGFELVGKAAVGGKLTNQIIGYFHPLTGNSSMGFPVSIRWDPASLKYRMKPLNPKPAHLTGISKSEEFAFSYRDRYDEKLTITSMSGKTRLAGYQSEAQAMVVDDDSDAFVYGYGVDGDCHACGETLELRGVSLKYQHSASCYWFRERHPVVGRESVRFRLPKPFAHREEIQRLVLRRAVDSGMNCP